MRPLRIFNREKKKTRQFVQRLDPDLLVLLLLLALGLIAYSNSFLASFHYDDIPHIVHNDAIRDPGNLGKIYAHCKERFLTYLTLAFNYRVSRLDRVSYHIFNFFVHYLAAFLLYFLTIETWKTPAMEGLNNGFSKKAVALLAAGIFLLHPLQTQSVTYLIQRAESMSGMFYLGALLFYLKARLTKQSHAAGGYYILMVVFALAAAFSKETAATLPAMVVVYEILFFKTSVRSLLKNKAILFLLVPAGLVVSYKLGLLVRRDFFYDAGSYFTRKQYFLTQFSVLVTYLKLFFWPLNLNLDWDFPVALTIFNVRTVASLSLLLFLVLLAILLAYRDLRFGSLGIIAFFVTLAPTSSIIPIKDLIYEHRMYLAVAFLAMGFVEILYRGMERLKDISPRYHRLGLYSAIVVILPLLACLSYARNEVWRSELSLWHDAVQKSPNKARPHVNYGMALYELGKIDDAQRHFEIANRLCSHCPTPYHNLAYIYWKQGNYQRAVELELEAVTLKPNYNTARYNLSRMYTELERWDEARIHLELLIRRAKNSRFLRAYVDLLDVYLHLGLDDEAKELVRMMIRLPDNMPRVDYYRGIACYALGNYTDAKVYFAKEKRQSKEWALSYLMLGQIHYLENEHEQAEEMFRKVLQEQPWSAMAHNNLAILLQQSGRLDEAVEHLEEVLAIEPFAIDAAVRLVTIYDYLGNAAERTRLLRKLLGLRQDSTEHAYLKAKENLGMSQVLGGYKEQFLSDESSSQSLKTMGIIATLQGDFNKAIVFYQRYLQASEGQRANARIAEEVFRLEGLLQGKELLRTPVSPVELAFSE
jgi:tetratricopeptide (TPR) repeat protein